MKKIILVIFLSFMVSINCKALNDLNIYDYSLLLKEKEINKLDKKIDKFKQKTNINLIVVTVRHHDYDMTYKYITEFYDKNIGGDAVVLAIDLKTNNIDIESFGSAEKIYTENRIKSILNSIKEEKDYYKKINLFIDDISKDYSIPVLNIDVSRIIISLILAIVITVLIVLNELKKVKNPKKSNKLLINYENVVLEKSQPQFITTHTNKIRK